MCRRAARGETGAAATGSSWHARHHAPIPALPSLLFRLRREAKARTANAQQGDRDFLESACTFLPACTPRQVRMAPEKCERAGGAAGWVGGGRLAGIVWAAKGRTRGGCGCSPPRAVCLPLPVDAYWGGSLAYQPPPLDPAAVVSLCRAVKAHCLVLDAPKRGVAPLRAAVAALCPSTDHLSPIHADFFQL